MGSTPLGITYPDTSSVVDPQADMQELAETTDAAISAVVGGLFKVGSVALTILSADNGRVTLPHALGRVPVFPAVSLGTTAYRAAVVAVTDTSLTVHIVNASTGADFVGNVSIRWFVA